MALGIGAYLFLGTFGWLAMSGADWTKLPGYEKVLLGLVGIVMDLAIVGFWAWDRQANPTSPAPSPSSSSASDPISGCLSLLASIPAFLYMLVTVYIPLAIGMVGGPVLLVWGIVDQFR